MEINTRMKKYHHYLTLLSLFMLLGILKLQAAIQLPAIFSNHMVLQRNSELTFWGWGIPGETISIAPEWMKGEIIKTQVKIYRLKECKAIPLSKIQISECQIKPNINKEYPQV